MVTPDSRPASIGEEPKLVLHDLAESALASPEFRQVMDRHGISREPISLKSRESADQILREAEPEYARYQQIRLEIRNASRPLDALSAWFLFVILGYLALPPRHLDWLAISITAAVLMFILVHELLRRARRTELTSLMSAARQQWIDTLRDTALLPFLRGELTARVHSATLYATEIDPQLAPGLLERSEPRHLVASRAMNKVESIVGGMTAGSLGISGRRGIGKTTLMSAFCSDRYSTPGSIPELRVLVSAPVDYDAYDFVLHIFTRLCETVLDKLPNQIGKNSRRRAVIMVNPRSAVGVLVLLLGLGLAVRAFIAPIRIPPETAARLALGLVGVIAIVLSLLLIFGRNGERIRFLIGTADRGQVLSMRERTLEQLNQLRFAQTSTASSAAGISMQLPIAAQSSYTFTKQLAEYPANLPQLVSHYVNYATDVATWWRDQKDGSGRLVIGIDEVDRINDPERAERFLNDIKTIFDVPYCFYLVTLSEDALATYEKRALTIRSAFDGAFDEIIDIDPLDFKASEELLAKRIIGLPRPFVALCQVLSGGLPRDLVRVARALIEISRTTDEYDLYPLAVSLVRRELFALKSASLHQLSGVTGNGDVLDRLHDKSWPKLTTEDLQDAAKDLQKELGKAADDSCSRVIQELAVSLSFFAAVLFTFSSGRMQLIRELRDHNSKSDVSTEELAQARYVMSVNITLAQRLVERYRTAR